MAAERMSATPCTGGRRCVRQQGVLATGRSVSYPVHPVLRHRRPAVRTRPAGHLGENDKPDTRTSAVVRPEFSPRNPVGRARAAGRHPTQSLHPSFRHRPPPPL